MQIYFDIFFVSIFLQEDALNKLVTELKSQEKEQSKEAAAVKGAKQNIASEKKKLSELQKVRRKYKTEMFIHVC